MQAYACLHGLVKSFEVQNQQCCPRIGAALMASVAVWRQHEQTLQAFQDGCCLVNLIGLLWVPDIKFWVPGQIPRGLAS